MADLDPWTIVPPPDPVAPIVMVDESIGFFVDEDEVNIAIDAEAYEPWVRIA